MQSINRKSQLTVGYELDATVFPQLDTRVIQHGLNKGTRLTWGQWDLNLAGKWGQLILERTAWAQGFENYK